LKYLNDLVQRYPNNIPVLYTLGNVDMLLRKPQNALPYYRRALQNADTNFRTFTAFANYRVGEAHFRLNEFDAAKASFQRFFKGKYERSFRGMALLRLSLCYEIAGDRAEAQKGYAKCTQLIPFEPDDKFAIRRAKEYIKNAPEAAQIQLLKGVNCVESSRFSEAEQFLRPLVENTSLSKEIRSEAAYNLGESLREQGRGAEAIPLYLKAVECEPERERWTMPWSYYRIATIQYNAGKTELSRSYIEKAKVFSGYDFEEWLQFNMYRDTSLLKY
jgi:tetratricopeptide (TPR) repeat protein